jgi:hypothetical protein
MALPFSGSAKPANSLLGVMPAGGASSTQVPGSRINSAAMSGRPAAASNSKERKTARRTISAAGN